MIIRITSSSLNPTRARIGGFKATDIYRRLFKRSQKRLIRYGLLVANLLLVAAVTGFILRNPSKSLSVQQSTAANAVNAISPLDEVSSADIAVHIARMANVAEATSVTNLADSINAQMAITPADNTVVAKPQIVATALKSRRDIQKYVTKDGDTVSSVAAKFGVTSNTIRWSNSLGNGEAIPAGKEIWVLPGVNGIVLTAQAGDTPVSLANRYQANKDQIIAYNDAEISGLPVGQKIIVPDGMQVARPAVVNFAFGFAATYGYNGYDYGYCTWWVQVRRTQIGRQLPSNLGNAVTWKSLAPLAGLGTGNAPQVGAIVWTDPANMMGSYYRSYGHVGFVEKINEDGSVWVSDMNSSGYVSMDTNSGRGGGYSRVSYRLLTPEQARNFTYIY